MKWPLIIALVLAFSATGTRADLYDDCRQEKDVERRIRGCTQIIELGDKEPRQSKVKAFISRGIAYCNRGDLDRAIADFNLAVALSPKEAIAHNSLGVAYAVSRVDDKASIFLISAIAIALSALAWTRVSEDDELPSPSGDQAAPENSPHH